MDIFLVGTNLDVIANLLAQLAAERHGPVVLNPPKRVSLQPPRYYEETAELQQAVLALGYRTNRSFLDDGYYALLVGNGILGGVSPFQVIY